MKPGLATGKSRRLITLLCLWCLLPLPGCGPGRSSRHKPAETLSLACAAGIRKPVQDVIRQYEAEYGVRVQANYAGSGALLSTLRAGGDGDLYLAADITYLKDASAKYGLVQEILPIATQSPVVAVARGNPKKIATLDDLLRDEISLSLANPKVAAISRVTQRILEKSNGWQPLWDRVTVERSTVNEVANDLKLRTADAGIIWDATANQYPELEIVPIPVLNASPNQITIGVLTSSKQPTRALHFARYLSARDKGLLRFKEHGYSPVQGDRWAEEPEIHIFAGGLNRPAIEQTIKQFEQREGAKVLTTFNGCGILVGQMKTGVQPDLYFSCDTSFMDMVQDLFWDPTDVSETDMLIIVPKGNQQGIRELKDLARPGLKIGLGSPEKSALGHLTKILLQKHGLYQDVRRNVRDEPATADSLVQVVVVGGMDAAIVYEANTAFQRDKLDLIPIPDPEAKAVQPIAVAKQSDFRHLAGRLQQAILSAESASQFKSLGFSWRNENETDE